MQKVNPNVEEDNFRKIMKGRLEGYSLPVSDDVWEKIESSLNKKPRKVILWPWISGAAAAAVLFILLLYPFNDKNDKDKQVNDYETTSPLPDYVKKIDTKRNFVIRKTKEKYAEANSRSEIDVVKEDIVSDEEPDISVPVSKSQAKNAYSEKSNHRETVVYPNPDPFGDDSSPIKKSKKRKSMGLSLGSGSNLAALNANSNGNFGTDDLLAQLRSNSFMAPPESKTEERLLIEEFPEITHRAPLSFGVTVKKELNRTFSLETGLVYTFLDSRFENRSLDRKALLQLHYIGIPLNVQARILGDKKSNWEIYLSAGGMIEKGIYSHYKQTNDANSNYVVEIVSNEKIDGLQYSLSFAPGIDYKIYRNYSIYFEPKIGYYFDNKQPVSIRTEHPVVIGINAGLRFSW